MLLDLLLLTAVTVQELRVVFILAGAVLYNVKESPLSLCQRIRFFSVCSVPPQSNERKETSEHKLTACYWYTYVYTNGWLAASERITNDCLHTDAFRYLRSIT